MNLTKKEVRQTGVAYAIPFKRPVNQTLKLKYQIGWVTVA